MSLDCVKVTLFYTFDLSGKQNVKIHAYACTRSCGVGQSNPVRTLFSSIRQVRLKYVDKFIVLVKYRYII